MGFLSGFLNIIILLGALQGLIFSGLLFYTPKDRPRNRSLAWLLLLMSVASLKLYGVEKEWFNNPLMQLLNAIIPTIVIMPLGPLVYTYVRSTLQPVFKLRPVHFLPVIIDLVPSLVSLFFILGVSFKWLVYNPGPWGRFIDDYNVYSDIPRWLSLSIYVRLSAKLLASQPIDQFQWLRQLIRSFQVFQFIWFLYLAPYVIPRFTDVMLTQLGWYPVYVPLAILIYWLGIKGYIVSQTTVAKKTTTLTPNQIEKTITVLTAVMEQDKLYLNPLLTVALVSEQTGITQKQISAVLNQYLNKSFNEFVNEYRVHAIKDRLLSGETAALTIAGLAYEGGFNSLPTFQRAFKAVLGQTPKEYVQKAGK